MSQLRIGDLGRIGGVSVRLRRHYHEIGLLVPDHVDGPTGTALSCRELQHNADVENIALLTNLINTSLTALTLTRHSSPQPKENNMTFHDTVMGRHATKSFDGRRVPADQVEALQDLIRHAATSYNVQPWRAVVIDDEARKQALAEVAYNQPQITSCSHLFVFCANTDLDSLVDRLEAQSRASGMEAEKVEAYISPIRGFTDGLESDQRLSWAQRQTYLALGNGINGAKALGFDSCPMEGFDPTGFAGVLGLPATLVPTVLMPIGYADSEPRPKLRFAHDDMFIDS